ncbi:MAG: hypothetical protein ABWW70_06070 [Thermoproteota archaeon]
MSSESYECRRYPCIHVVVDYPRRKFALFLEMHDGELVHVPFEELERAYREASSLLAKRFREAEGEEVDAIASELLGAEPVEPEE